MKKLKIGLLSTADNPLLSFYVSSCRTYGVDDLHIIFDKKTESEKNKKIWNDRTNGAFKKTDDWFAKKINFSSDQLPPSHFVENHNSSECEKLINKLQLSVLVNIGTPRKLNSKIINATKIGIINIHPGLLPKYRGSCAVEWAVLNDDKVGNTVHFMTEDYDAGNIIKSEWYKFKKNCNYPSLRVTVYRNGCILLGKTLNLIKEKNVRSNNCIKQDDTKAITRKPISNSELEIVKKKLNKGKYKYQCL